MDLRGVQTAIRHCGHGGLARSDRAAAGAGVPAAGPAVQAMSAGAPCTASRARMRVQACSELAAQYASLHVHSSTWNLQADMLAHTHITCTLCTVPRCHQRLSMATPTVFDCSCAWSACRWLQARCASCAVHVAAHRRARSKQQTWHSCCGHSETSRDIMALTCSLRSQNGCWRNPAQACSDVCAPAFGLKTLQSRVSKSVDPAGDAAV